METGSYILMPFLSVVFYCSQCWTENSSFIILVVRKHETQKCTKMRKYILPKLAVNFFEFGCRFDS